jgi:NADH-quinone oxidoreductase subunit A
MVFSWMNMSILAFLVAGFAFAIGPIVVSILLAPKVRGGAFAESYECGIPIHGRQARVRFGLTFYFYALIFLAFDVDVLYLFPVAAMYPDTVGWVPFWQLLAFITVLFAAIFYFSSKGVFSWPRRIRVSPRR